MSSVTKTFNEIIDEKKTIFDEQAIKDLMNNSNIRLTEVCIDDTDDIFLIVFDKPNNEFKDNKLLLSTQDEENKRYAKFRTTVDSIYSQREEQYENR